MSADLLEPKQRAITEPPKRWKNRWRETHSAITVCHACGREERTEPGEIFETCCRTYPSEDVARTHAEEIQRCNIQDGVPAEELAEYLGPFPVDL